MLESTTRCWAEVDLEKIAHNVQEIHKLIPEKTKIMAIVKANAYGHGDLRITQEMIRCGVDFFGVSSIDEALHLRTNGIQEKILVLGYTPPIHFHYLHEYNILQTLISRSYAQDLEDYCAAQKVEVNAHIKVDTGMSRLGVQCKEERWEIEDVKAMYRFPHLTVTGIFSHFSVSDSLDEDDRNFSDRQVVLFDRVLACLKQEGIEPGVTHLANSYGIINYPDLAYDYVRPGLLHLGVTSNDQVKTLRAHDFQPIMSWKANVSYVKDIEVGSFVSYGRNYEVTKKIRVATISVGYADGYPRSVSNKGKEVLLHGQRAKIVGNICMDQMMIDVSDIEDVKQGDEVVLFGYDGDVLLAVDELSRYANTINNETLCWVGARVPRIYDFKKR